MTYESKPKGFELILIVKDRCVTFKSMLPF